MGESGPSTRPVAVIKFCLHGVFEMAATDNPNIEAAVKAYILAEFLPDEAPAALTDMIPLLSNGILDSIATLKLVAFLEQRFHITVAPHEVTVDNLNTVAGIAQLVRTKQRGGPA
jgi:acyl carrier protein